MSFPGGKTSRLHDLVFSSFLYPLSSQSFFNIYIKSVNANTSTLREGIHSLVTSFRYIYDVTRHVSRLWTAIWCRRKGWSAENEGVCERVVMWCFYPCMCLRSFLAPLQQFCISNADPFYMYTTWRLLK